MIAKINITNPNLENNSTIENEQISFELLLSTIYKGEDGKDGKSAYEIAVENGFEGTEEEWLESLGGNISVEEWNAESNANNYIETGIFHFAGYRTNANDNLPIDTVDAKANIAFTIIVDKAEGYLEGTTHVPTIVSQTLFLGNRQGSETKAYVRNCTKFFDGQPDKWESWRELTQTTYLGVLTETLEGETLKSVTENGLYTGALLYPPNTFDIFKLEVMNNYAMAQLYGSGNTVLQKITILHAASGDGIYNRELTRKGTWNGSAYEWEDWDEATFVSTPDWNQSDETATDYIKNRTHYETIAKHVGLTNDEYNAKLKDGKSFSLVKMHSITIENSQCTRINSNVQEGNVEEFNGLLNGIYWGYLNGIGYSYANTNSTLVSPMIKINGKKVLLNWDEAGKLYVGYPATSSDGLDTVMYGIGKPFGNNGRYIYAKGFVLKDYRFATKVNGETMPDMMQGTSSYETFLIDKTIYGEAPYTIDFYFECEQTIKKLDEKFLPDGIKPKHKTGDVVVCTDRTGYGIFKVIPWEEYEATPSKYPDAIGLVADPVKRTFLFCELLKKPFASIANIKKYLYGYTSLIDGQDTYRRLTVGGSIAGSFPAFYDLRCVSKPGTIFYQKQFSAYTPALFEWEKAYDALCVPFYDDPINLEGNYASLIDRLIALKNGTEIKSDAFFYFDSKNNFPTVYYSQLSSVGLLGSMDNYPYNDIAPFVTTGNVPEYDTLNYNVSPVFGIYTEDEE